MIGVRFRGMHQEVELNARGFLDWDLVLWLLVKGLPVSVRIVSWRSRRGVLGLWGLENQDDYGRHGRNILMSEVDEVLGDTLQESPSWSKY